MRACPLIAATLMSLVLAGTASGQTIPPSRTGGIVPPVTLTQSFVDTESNYSLQFTAPNALHYGGPGPC